jgi:transcription initiation factor TFIIA large subunit
MPQPGPPEPHAPINYAQPPMPAGNPGLSFPQPAVKPEPGVKLEPGLDGPTPLGAPNPNVQARVMQNLHAQYGARANATIGKLQDSMGQAAPEGHQTSATFAYTGPPAPQDPSQQHRPLPPPSQLDGADDQEFEGVLLHRSASGQTTELGRVEIDRMLHAQIAAQASAMEGGGLMLPLRRAGKQSAAVAAAAPGSRGDDTLSGRYDGGDDDVKSEDDDEAINSDLDDPDDNVEEEEDEDETSFTMLCMYDKVQRVKNKW